MLCRRRHCVTIRLRNSNHNHKHHHDARRASQLDYDHANTRLLRFGRS